jgi:hypothetical protein
MRRSDRERLSEVLEIALVAQEMAERGEQRLQETEGSDNALLVKRAKAVGYGEAVADALRWMVGVVPEPPPSLATIVQMAELPPEARREVWRS